MKRNFSTLGYRRIEFCANKGAKIVNTPLPLRLNPKEILVKVNAVSLNPIDVRMIQGYSSNLRQWSLSSTLPGRDAVGEVVLRGSHVDDFIEGDQVWISSDPKANGTFGDYCVCTEEEVDLKPASISSSQAASLPFAITTAYSALKIFFPELMEMLQPILISRKALTSSNPLHFFLHGGSGSVGTIALILLKLLGHQVSVSCSSKQKDRLHRLGLSEQEMFFYDCPRSFDMIPSNKFHCFIDFVGGKMSEMIALSCLRPSHSLATSHYISLRGSLVSNIDDYGLLYGLAKSVALRESKQQLFRNFASNSQSPKNLAYHWCVDAPNQRILEFFRQLIDEQILWSWHSCLSLSSSSPAVINSDSDSHFKDLFPYQVLPTKGLDHLLSTLQKQVSVDPSPPLREKLVHEL